MTAPPTQTPRPGVFSELARHWRRAGLRGVFTHYIVDGIHEEEARAARALNAARPNALFWKLTTLLVVASVSLTLLEYYGMRQSFWDRYQEDMLALPRETSQLYELLYWVSWATGVYLILPILVITLLFRERLSDYGLTLRGFTRHLPLYAVMFVIVGVLVLIVAQDPVFQDQYPFYRFADRAPLYFWIWELAYFLQFFSLEFFFRGFLVHGLKARFGVYSIMVMTVPYCLIHFGKPLPETLGAIIAGMVLGFLSLRTGSIFLGFLIHISIALSMDLASLYHQGKLGAVFNLP